MTYLSPARENKFNLLVLLDFQVRKVAQEGGETAKVAGQGAGLLPLNAEQLVFCQNC